MQEPERNEQPQQAAKRKPLFALGVAAVVVVLLLAALLIAHSIINNSYTTHLDRLKGMVAEAAGQLEQGDAGASPEGQYRFYLGLIAQTANLSDILSKLNDSYPLLLTKSDEERTGITALKAGVDALAPGLTSFKACIDEDASIAGGLSALTAKEDAVSSEYTDIQSANAALGAQIDSLAFKGALEGSRQALADAVARRGQALQFLIDNASAGEQYIALLADTASDPADQIAKLTELKQKNDELEGRAAGAGLDSFGAAGAAIAGQPAVRKATIDASIAYLNELSPVLQSVRQFNDKLTAGINSGSGKFSKKLASWMAWVKELNTISTKLKAVNDKPEYKDLTIKRTLANMGLSEMGQSLNSYANALNTVNSAMTMSAAIEKEIDAMLKDTKLQFKQRVAKSEDLLKRNDTVLARAAAQLPPDLAAGQASFVAACKERKVFLNEYMSYAESKVLADGHKASRSFHLSEYSYYKGMASTDPANAEFYNSMASQHSGQAADELTKYNQSQKDANAHKKAYEASRKKYTPMLDK